MPRQLTLQEAHEFLDSRPGWIALTTIGPDGFPHTVPLGYFRLGDDILMGVRTNTRKLRNIQDNPKVSLLLEPGKPSRVIKGLMVQGAATVHSNPEEVLHYAREAAKLRGVPEHELPTEPRTGAAYIKVTPQRMRSWDYSTDAA
jgi:nitroimidazol reductase NimA-like FMN-containing flavoprotein (pyridoxamine 5'-phosphate oxidase superfamily)